MCLSEADVRRIFAVISGRFGKAAALVEIMDPMIVKCFREKSIEGSHAKFTPEPYVECNIAVRRCRMNKSIFNL